MKEETDPLSGPEIAEVLVNTRIHSRATKEELDDSKQQMDGAIMHELKEDSEEES